MPTPLNVSPIFMNPVGVSHYFGNNENEQSWRESKNAKFKT